LLFQFQKRTSGDDRVPFGIWSRPELEAQTAYAGEIGPRILAFYEETFGVDFPLPKQDMVASTDLR